MEDADGMVPEKSYASFSSKRHEEVSLHFFKNAKQLNLKGFLQFQNYKKPVVRSCQVLGTFICKNLGHQM